MISYEATLKGRARVRQTSNLDEFKAVFGDEAAKLGAAHFRIVRYAREEAPPFRLLIDNVPEALSLDAVSDGVPDFYAKLLELMRLNQAFDSQQTPECTIDREGVIRSQMAERLSRAGLTEFVVVPRFGFVGLMGYTVFFLKQRIGHRETAALFALGSAGVRCAIDLDQGREREASKALTTRQVQVLQYCAQGKSDWEIAQLLGLSPATVHDHIEAAKRRLGVRTRVQAVLRAAQMGWLECC